uniref:Uncharacterized protein n=1 Tax=Octopus bimaculoides TaxID=37653 RepID=A0A0L8FJI9_OCTBM
MHFVFSVYSSASNLTLITDSNFAPSSSSFKAKKHSISFLTSSQLIKCFPSK